MSNKLSALEIKVVEFARKYDVICVIILIMSQTLVEFLSIGSQSQ